MPSLQVVIDAAGAKIGANTYKNATINIIAQSNKASKGVKRLDKSIGGLGTAARTVGRAVGALAGGFAAIQGIRSAISTIATFEETMAKVGGVANATSKQLQDLNKAARDAGASTRFSASEAGEGLLFLSRAGFESSESVKALPSVLNLATAGFLDLGFAADIASNILSQFSLEASETARVGDVLVATANSANTSVQQLAEAFKFVGPVAGSLNKSIEEVAAAVGVLGNAGIQASLAGTNLRGIFAKLIGPTGGAKDAIEDLGLSLEDVNPETKSIVEIFKTLEKAGLGVSESFRIFGLRNFGAAIQLSKNSDELERLEEKAKAASGTTERFASILNDTIIGQFKQLKSTIEEVILSFGDSGFAGSLKSTIGFITDVIRSIAGMETQFKDIEDQVETVTKVLKATFGALGGIALLKAFIVVVKLTATAIKLAFATNPIGLLTLAIGAAAAALITYKDETIKIGDETVTVGALVAGVWDTIKSRVIKAADAIEIEIIALKNLSIETLNVINDLMNVVGIGVPGNVALAAPGPPGPEGPTFIQESKARTAANMRQAKADKEARDAARAAAEAESLESKKRIEEVNKEIAAFEELLKKHEEALAKFDELGGAASKVRSIGDSTGQVFSEALEAIAFDARSAGEAIRILTQDLLRMITQILVLKPLANLISGSIQGVFAPTAPTAPVAPIPVKAASGSIINKRTILAGEAGPEAILPLMRGVGGRLGVETSGGSGGNNIVVNMTVNTPNPDAFRASQRQITSVLRKTIGGV